jgi:hypothetical protein
VEASITAGIFEPRIYQRPEPRRYDFQPLNRVLDGPVQLALAAWAGLVADVDDNPNPRPG